MNEPSIVRKEMGYSRKEFFRLLPKALASEDFSIEGDTITLKTGKRRLEIELGPETERRIALLHIPTMPVTLKFFGYDAEAQSRFMAHFDHSYQRGGG